MTQTVTLPNWITIDHGLGDLTALVPRLQALNQKLVFWFKAGLNPAMLAFLRLLTDMDRPLAGGKDAFTSIGGIVDTQTSSPLFAITMMQPNQPGTAV
jgi:hypothetical protein